MRRVAELIGDFTPLAGDRKFGDDIGRRKMLLVFEMAAGEPELVDDFRSKLSGVLY